MPHVYFISRATTQGMSFRVTTQRMSFRATTQGMSRVYPISRATTQGIPFQATTQGMLSQIPSLRYHPKPHRPCTSKAYKPWPYIIASLYKWNY